MEAWHAQSEKEVMKKLDARREGLSKTEARKRLEQYGRNSIAIEKKISAITIFVNQFRNLLVLVLVLAAFVSLGVSYLDPEENGYFDAILIFVIVILNAIFGFVQEYKAERSIEALTKMSAPRATVIRDGSEKEVPSEEVVPGDILVLREGDKVAADARLLETYSLYADESSLTGESVPSAKQPGTLKEKMPLADQANMVFMNTAIARGKGMAVVVQTGLKTEVGKIARQISEAPEKVTQFQLEIADVGKKISLIVLAILVVIVATEFLLRTGDLLFIFIAAVALGVAAIPEGLPAVVTLSLSIATNRMLKQHTLMRRLSTVQDLGAVDVICTDKTGTLTENIMTVTRVYTGGISYDVKGKGWDKRGAFVSPRGSVKDLEWLLRCAALCNDAREDGDHQRFRGDPTEIAVLLPAYKAGIDPDALHNEWKRIDEIPFSSERKMMSTVNQHGKETYAFVKGAPEVILERCTHIYEGKKQRRLTAKERKQVLEHNKEMASDALRVLAFAYKYKPRSHAEKDVENDLVFLGLMGMIDPPRSGVKEAITDCRKAGIRVIMITGDNPYTAAAIGKELGFEVNTLTGQEMDELSEEELARAVEKVAVYARTSPKHKTIILQMLKRNNHVVAMTGDGVNDAPAIKNSDVGIAMGIRGTEVTKQASDFIVLDDNFVTIRNAVAEGRGAFDNIRKFVTLLIGANTSEVLAVFVASLLPMGLSPKIAVHLLWINLLTDGLPALALGAGSPASDVMERKPRPKTERLLHRPAFYFIAWLGLFEALLILVLYGYYFAMADATKAYTIFFTSFVVLESVSVYLVRWRYKTPFLSNKWVHLAIGLSLLLQLAVLYTPAAEWFQVVPLEIMDWMVLALAGFALIAIIVFGMSLEKYFIRKDSYSGPQKKAVHY